nr:MAG TPA_asm: hypothetical protein [Caudoviricetes sp.]
MYKILHRKSQIKCLTDRQKWRFFYLTTIFFYAKLTI